MRAHNFLAVDPPLSASGQGGVLALLTASLTRGDCRKLAHIGHLAAGEGDGGGQRRQGQGAWRGQFDDYQ